VGDSSSPMLKDSQVVASTDKIGEDGDVLVGGVLCIMLVGCTGQRKASNREAPSRSIPLSIH
jgi:hypothetical protein